ncbi:hypothetical protein HAX54_027030 [Datura stramonium]|uniref:Uncharacterized protein n=1 Tax=Datura stramonium TaxID=4076 RepID=A0ABS8V1V5_DATST|nr:hypothetical protein [Datura stramonium]
MSIKRSDDYKFVLALKSGQLPADLSIGDYDVPAKQEDKMVTDGDDEVKEQEESEPEEETNGPSDMEQMCLLVDVNLNCAFHKLSKQLGLFSMHVGLRWISMLMLYKHEIELNQNEHRYHLQN